MRGVQWGRAGCGRPIVRMLQFQPTAQVLKGYVYLNPTNLKISVTDLVYQLKKFLVMNYRNYSWKEFFSKDRRLSSNTEQQTLLILQLVVDNRSIATENVGWWLSVSLEIDHAVYVGACAQPGGQREAYRLFRFQGPKAASSSPYLWDLYILQYLGKLFYFLGKYKINDNWRTRDNNANCHKSNFPR